MKLTKAWAVDAGERILGTFVAAFFGALIVSTGAGVTLPAIESAGLAGLAAVVTLVKSLAGAYIGNPSSASILPSVGKSAPIPPATFGTISSITNTGATGATVALTGYSGMGGADWPFYHPPGEKPQALPYPSGPLKPLYPASLKPPSSPAPARRIPADRISPLRPMG